MTEGDKQTIGRVENVINEEALVEIFSICCEKLSLNYKIIKINNIIKKND